MDKFPDWRELDSAALEQQLDWPSEGICFDIEHADEWKQEWGPKPETLDQALKLARMKIAEAPKLIPIRGHRYLPSVPREEGNPVFSAWQTDIIFYGRDLKTYFAHEFGNLSHTDACTGSMTYIEFWTDIVLAGGSLG